MFKKPNILFNSSSNNKLDDDNIESADAFTIVELLIVIVIIGILAAITIVSYAGITKKAGESSVQAELSNASKKLSIYYTLNGTYPTSIDQSTGCPTAPVADNQNCIKFGSGTTFSYNFKTASTYGLSATKGLAAYLITESSGPVAFMPSFVKTWGGTGSEFGQNLVQTRDGGYVITGFTIGVFSAGIADMFLAKYDASGNLVWNKTWGGTGDDEGKSLVQTIDGGYAVTGYTGSYGAGNPDMFLIKYDADGNLVWNKTWGGTGIDHGQSLVQTSDGGYAVTGDTASYGGKYMFLAKYDTGGSLVWNKTWVGTGDSAGRSLIQTSDGGYAVTGSVLSGNNNMFLAKYDTSGNLVWNKTWGGTSAEYGDSLVQTSDGGYAVTGYTASYGAGDADMLLIKYDTSGNLVWNKTWGGTSAEYGDSLIQTSDGGYAVTGHANSFGAGSVDMFLVKYDTSGNLVWNKTWGGTGDDEGLGLVQTSDGGYAVAGYTNSYGVGGYDASLTKYDTNGNLNNCSSPMCQIPTATVNTPTATITTPSATITTPTATITSPTATITTPAATSKTIVEP